MHATKPVIQLAKERALFRFSALAARMLQDANSSITQLIPTASSASEQKTISLSKEFLLIHGQEFLKRLNVSYFGYVERAMQTMYRDLRPGLHGVSADTLSLVDDDTITRQIEVERRVLRLRDADQQSLGRLNLMIAQLHDEHDVRERENPFRPYLMARALHDVLCEMTTNSNVCAMLFDHMSGALAEQLPEYFAAIRDVFESNGVNARLLARPSTLTKRDREVLAASNQSQYRMTHAAANSQNIAQHSDRVHASPALERVLAQLQKKDSDINVGNVMPAVPSDGQTVLQDFVWKIFNQSAPGRIPPNPRYPDGAANTRHRENIEDELKASSHPLVGQLHQLQQDAAVGGDEGDIAVEAEADLKDVLDSEQVSDMDKMAMDVVAMLFDYVASEEAIAPAFRGLIAQLHIPFLKATMLDPDVLQQPDHAARRFLNRATSMASGLNAETTPGKEIHAGMVLAVERVLKDFKENTKIFDETLEQFNAVVEEVLSSSDADVSHAIDALENAQKNPQQHDVLVVQTVNALRERLATIETDQRAVDFLIKVWSRVLVCVSENDAIDIQPYRDVIPDLIWSVQAELDASERSTLMRLLPKLVQRVKTGLQLLLMSENEARQVMDELVAMHAEVLRTIQANPMKRSIGLASLQQHFSSLHIGSAPVVAMEIHAPTVPDERLKAALLQFGVSAHLHLDSDLGTLLSSDAKWLGDMQAGTAVEYWMNGSYLSATLMWVDAQQSFYLFKLNEGEEAPRLLIYSSIALIKALREGSVGMMEFAPIFDRAMESLLNANDVQQLAT
jgi:hypothetical protein